MAGDYTEGPFSENVLIENNRFLQTATVNRGPGQVSNRAALEMMGCTPVGSCGFSGNSPLPSSAPDAKPLVERRGGIIRTAEMGTFVGDTAATLRTLKYLGDSALEGVQMGVYGSHGLGCPDTQAGCPHPTNLIVSVDASSFAPDGHGWQQAHFNQTLVLSNGTFWLAHWYTAGQVWRTAHATGVTSWAQWLPQTVCCRRSRNSGTTGVRKPQSHLQRNGSRKATGVTLVGRCHRLSSGTSVTKMVAGSQSLVLTCKGTRSTTT